MNFKKVLSFVLAAALLLGVGLAMPVRAEEDENMVTDLGDQEVEVIFWHAMNGEQEASLTKLADQFMEENPNITVTLQNQSSYGDLSQKLATTMQSPQDLPTMAQAYQDWMVPMMAEGLIVPLEGYIYNRDENLRIDDYDKDVLKGMRKGVVYDDHIVALPFNKSTEVLWYNKSLLEELNLEVPTTFEELAEVSKTIYEEKGIPGCGWDSLTNYYMTYLYNNGGLTVDEELDVTGEESLAAVNYYLDGIREGYFRIAGTDNYMSGPFGNEQVAMYIGSNAGETYVREGAADKFEYAAAPYPTNAAIQQGTDVYIFASASSEERTAAYLFLRFLTDTEPQITWALETGYVPIRTSSIEDEAYTQSDSAIASILAEATEELYFTQARPGSNQARTDLEAFLESLFAQPDQDAEAALEDFKEDYAMIWEDAAMLEEENENEDQEENVLDDKDDIRETDFFPDHADLVDPEEAAEEAVEEAEEAEESEEAADDAEEGEGNN